MDLETVLELRLATMATTKLYELIARVANVAMADYVANLAT